MLKQIGKSVKNYHVKVIIIISIAHVGYRQEIFLEAADNIGAIFMDKSTTKQASTKL